MTNGLHVFNFQAEFFDVNKVKAVLDRPLDPLLIKKRKQGSTDLSYIGGHTVIRLLNEAFGLKWSFEIVTEEVIESLPKPVFSGYGQKRQAVLNEDGSQKMEPQPPVAKVLGRLTVPGLGVKEQYGSKVLIGGATEQESAFKSASTDAMKKCASLFGIGLELYESEEEREVYSQTAHAIQSTQPTQPTEHAQPIQEPTQQTTQQTTPEPTQQVYQPVKKQAEVATEPQANQWQQSDINKLKELKTILYVTDNDQLDPYVREFMDRQDVTYMNIIPTNIKAFNVFLSKKVQNV